jgi:hypothetical protein
MVIVEGGLEEVVEEMAGLLWHFPKGTEKNQRGRQSE